MRRQRYTADRGILWLLICLLLYSSLYSGYVSSREAGESRNSLYCAEEPGGRLYRKAEATGRLCGTEAAGPNRSGTETAGPVRTEKGTARGLRSLPLAAWQSSPLRLLPQIIPVTRLHLTRISADRERRVSEGEEERGCGRTGLLPALVPFLLLLPAPEAYVFRREKLSGSLRRILRFLHRKDGKKLLFHERHVSH